jgi:hypothetical protein
MTTKKIKGTPDAWESGTLGESKPHSKALSIKETKADLELINEELGLQPISIRLEKSLIDDFKAIASINGLGYQTLMRQALKRFADCEKKDILRRTAAEMKKRKEVGLASSGQTPAKKAA